MLIQKFPAIKKARLILTNISWHKIHRERIQIKSCFAWVKMFICAYFSLHYDGSAWGVFSTSMEMPTCFRLFNFNHTKKLHNERSVRKCQNLKGKQSYSVPFTHEILMRYTKKLTSLVGFQLAESFIKKVLRLLYSLQCFPIQVFNPKRATLS